LNGLEAAIRNALERTGNPDAAQRNRVYQSARAAAEKAFAAQQEAGQAGPDDIAAQRAGIEAIIERIEYDEAARERRSATPSVEAPAISLDGVTRAEPAPALPPVSEPAPVLVEAPEPAAAVPPADRTEDRFSEDAAPVSERAAASKKRQESGGDDLSVVVSRDDRFDGPSHAAPVATASKPTSTGKSWFRTARSAKSAQTSKTTRAAKPRRKRSGLIGLAVQLGLLFGFVALLLWFISLNGGLEQAGRNLLESGSGMVSGEGGGGPSGQRVGAGQFSGEWTVAFEPGGDELPTAAGAVEFEEIEEDGRPALLITSVSAGEDGELQIPLNETAVELMQAGPVLLALTVHSADDEPTQIYVRCEIAGVGDGCGRRRFDVGNESIDVLFDLDAQGMSGSDAALILNSDVEGEGKPVTLYSIRLQPAADA
jgi:hypothetical protein